MANSSEYNYRQQEEDPTAGYRGNDLRILENLNGEERQTLEGILSDASRREDLLADMFKPENSAMVGRPEAIESYHQDLRFTQDIKVVEGFATKEDVTDKHVIGNLPLHLEAEAQSITTYAVTSTLDQREARGGESWSAEEFSAMEKNLVTYQVNQLEVDPRDYPTESMVVVTRHEALVEALQERGIIDGDTLVVSHLDDPRDLEGKILVGVGSAEMKLAAEAVITVDYDRATDSYGDVNVYSIDPMMSYPAHGDGPAQVYPGEPEQQYQHQHQEEGDPRLTLSFGNDLRAAAYASEESEPAVRETLTDLAQALSDTNPATSSAIYRAAGYGEEYLPEPDRENLTDAAITGRLLLGYQHDRNFDGYPDDEMIRGLRFLNSDPEVASEQHAIIDELRFTLTHDLAAKDFHDFAENGGISYPPAVAVTEFAATGEVSLEGRGLTALEAERMAEWIEQKDLPALTGMPQFERELITALQDAASVNQAR